MSADRHIEDDDSYLNASLMNFSKSIKNYEQHRPYRMGLYEQRLKTKFKNAELKD